MIIIIRCARSASDPETVKPDLDKLLDVEKIPVFGQIKYILNIDTMWVLCSKMLIPLSFDSHLHAYRVK